MTKSAFFYIDDVIWAFRDVARQRPTSLFDQSFFGSLREIHQQYGLKVQLNLFFRTDYYYGNDEFTLAEMPADYKAEFSANAHWLRLSFHAKQEFPDYPHVNVDYRDFKDQLLTMQAEVFRFAGEQSWTLANVVGHWLPLSKDACRVLAECGTKWVSSTVGAVEEYTGDPNSLPYGHAGRLLHNRKPETKLYRRGSRDVAIDRSICGYNHITEEAMAPYIYTFGGYTDPETGLIFRDECNAGCTNLCANMEQVREDMLPALDGEHLCFGTHEQYFFPTYFAYQPDIVDKVRYSCQLVTEAGFTFVNGDELVK